MIARVRIALVARLPLGDSTVVIRGGRAEARRGRPKADLLSELTLLAEAEGVRSACIHATTLEGGGFRLRIFGVPKRLHQRIRNVWGANRR